MAPIDQVRVCSMALSHLGNKSIRQMTQPGNSAEACRLWWDQARQEALRGAPWNFAKRFKSGLEMAVDPFPPYAKAFAYPPEALRVFYLHTTDGLIDERAFKVSARGDNVGGKLINTNATAPVIIYTVDVLNPGQWDADFVTAFTYLLASRMAMSLTKSKSLEDALAKKFISAASVAEAAARNEGAQTEEPMGYYQAVR